MKRIILLGSTGSIGESTLDIVRRMPDLFRIAALSCGKNAERLEAQVKEFGPAAAALTAAGDGAVFDGMGARIFSGADAAVRVVEETDAEIVVNGISGAAGLLPSLAALRTGKDLALANKESMVMAGPLLREEARKRGRAIIPVDSEHAALFRILSRLDPGDVEELFITASGGAFRDLPMERLSEVTAADALRHPTWKMGPKITIDSATMANKGLEVMEARRLFGVEAERIKVLIHPQSLVHAMARTRDGALHMEASTTDMRIPIQNALTYPAVMESPVPRLDLSGRSLTFDGVDGKRYPMLALAYRAIALSPSHPIVYNAANEAAVDAFMKGSCAFLEIPEVVEKALSRPWPAECGTVAGILSVDAEARRIAKELVQCS